jgi:SagB-type dehydrogenase family enzyme
MDWENQPSPFKDYGGAARIDLPRSVTPPPAGEPGYPSPLFPVSGPGEPRPAPSAPFGPQALGVALHHGAGLTRQARHAGGTFHYRACPSAGGLYPCEVYLSWPGGGGLDAGLYHYAPARHALSRLRTGHGDPSAFGLPRTPCAAGEALLFVTAVFFRSAWKYRERAYRYACLDAGHVVEGLALGLAALNAAPAVETLFDVAAAGEFLGLDCAREGCLAMIRFPSNAAPGDPAAASPGHLLRGARDASRCSPSDANPVALLEAHAACAGRPTGTGAMPDAPGSTLGRGLSFTPIPGLPGPPERLGMFAAMASRKSVRNFEDARLPPGLAAKALSSLGGLLYPPARHPDGRAPADASGGGSLGFHPPGPHPAEHACQVGVLAGPGVFESPGFAVLDRLRLGCAMPLPGESREDMAVACLDQSWLKNAAMHVLFFVDPGGLETVLGGCGYRAAHINAGRLGHRIYLAAGSMGLGACAVGAFYDREAAGLLKLPAGMELAYLVAAGAARGGK